jgi:hypothetical protein
MTEVPSQDFARIIMLSADSIRLMSSSAHEKKELQENRGEDRMSGQPEVI